MEERYYIYTLSGSKENVVRYVGWTTDPKKRLKIHLYQAKYKKNVCLKKTAWIESLIESGQKLTITIVEEISARDISWKEWYWIKHYHDIGAPLTNHYSPKKLAEKLLRR